MCQVDGGSQTFVPLDDGGGHPGHDLTGNVPFFGRWFDSLILAWVTGDTMISGGLDLLFDWSGRLEVG